MMCLTEAGAAVHMQARARMAFTIVGAPGVDTSMLAAAVMDLALVNICRGGQRQTGEKCVQFY